MDARPDETLDAAKVDAWLKPRVPGLAGAPRVTQYAAGASNWTYRLEYESHDLVLRRPPAGTRAKSAHDMRREHAVQRRLRPVFPWVPEMVAYCDDASVIGAEFYVMRRLEGVVPRAGWEPPFAPAGVRQLAFNFVDTLVALHQVDPAAAGLLDLGKGPGYPRRQIDGWSDRYRKARTWNAPRLADVMRWLDARVPADARICVVHNDYRLDNVVLDAADPTRIVGVLDWEMATLGDPLMDVGNSLAYWVEEGDDFLARATRRQPSHLPGMLTRRELVERYSERMGLRPASWAFYEVYGLFRLAAIAQQIYYRYHHRQTRNPAFRRFWLLVHYLGWRCRRRIRAGD